MAKRSGKQPATGKPLELELNNQSAAQEIAEFGMDNARWNQSTLFCPIFYVKCAYV